METEQLCAASAALEGSTGSRTGCAESSADDSPAGKGWDQTRIPLAAEEGRLIASALISDQREQKILSK